MVISRVAKININNWLNSKRVYADGVAIYNRYGHLDSLKHLFAYHHLPNKLLTALSGLLNNVGDNTIPTTTPLMPAAAGDKKEPGNTLLMVQNHWRSLYKQASSIQATLELLPTKEDRYKAALHINNLFDEIETNWVECDYYNLHGKWPINQPIHHKEFTDLTPIGRIKARNNLRSQVSKYKKELLKTHPPERELELRTMLDTFNIQLTQLNQIIQTDEIIN